MNWIKFTDRLPDYYQPILAICDNKHQVVCWRASDGETSIYTIYDTNKIVTYEMTHWQPLPEPPNGFIINDAVLYTGAFMQYLINVGIRSLEYNYDDKVIFDNIEYFRLCKEHNLSAYKALLFLQDYIDGDYKF